MTSPKSATEFRFAQVSTGVTLRENNLKELQGGRIMDSQGVLVGNRAALLARPQLLAIVHELIERFEAHLTAGACVQIGFRFPCRRAD